LCGKDKKNLNMKCVIQRVSFGSIAVNQSEITHIDSGLAVFLGIEEGDCEKDLVLMARKISGIRIFEDETGKMKCSLSEHQKILLISQFTLLGSIKQGFRPDFTKAENPEKANEMYKTLIRLLREEYSRTVEHGIFGAVMEVHLTIDGPVTIQYDTRR